MCSIGECLTFEGGGQKLKCTVQPSNNEQIGTFNVVHYLDILYREVIKHSQVQFCKSS